MGSCSKTKVDRVRPRVDTLLRFLAFNPVLCDQELSYDTTSRKFKVGDGITPWVDLPYNTTEGTSTVSIEEGTNITITGSGTSGDPYIINSEAVGGGGSEVTDISKRTALKNNTNWVNPVFPGDTYYPIMGFNQPTGQNEHDYYIGYDSVNTTTLYRYSYEKIDSVLAWIRTPIAFSIPTA